MKYSISLYVPADAGNQISLLLLGVSCDLWGRHSAINEDYRTAAYKNVAMYLFLPSTGGPRIVPYSHSTVSQ